MVKLLLVLSPAFLCAQSVPRTWDEASLKDWATPIAALGVRPGHFSAADYYQSPVDNYRTYPVYSAGREPAGYWDRLRTAKPEPLFDRSKVKSQADWIAAGKIVFAESDIGSFRRYEPAIIDEFHKADSKRIANLKPDRDGIIPGPRWIVTDRGLAITVENCALCHRRRMPDGSYIDGPGMLDMTADNSVGVISNVPGMSTVALPGDTENLGAWRSFAVPWLENDIHEQIKTMPPRDLGRLFGLSLKPNLSPRWNGSLFYATKIPDLISLKGQKYIDHTATHKLRGPGDIMRYAALVTYCDITDYGPYRMLTDEQRKIPYHLPDDALYAMALYIESLQPPQNPNPSDEKSSAGKNVFDREGCGRCHAPPYYTSGKLTLAAGFKPSKELAREYDILAVSVQTDPSLAMKTRKGTGFYKIPSLRGVWYRGRYLHDGAVTTLEELFNVERLKPEFVPSGFKGADNHRAVPGHEFGLRLPASERDALIAFLKTL
ncbi:MAG TPA: hypothetical protein VFB63_04405 [Bryobacteraceae bacterium]|nr:hypothetical protein [Bryobacteraceae bacterium]